MSNSAFATALARESVRIHKVPKAHLVGIAGAAKTLDERELVGRLDNHLAEAVGELAAAHRVRVRMAHAMTQMARPEATRSVVRSIGALLRSAEVAAM